MKCPMCNVNLMMSERHGVEIDYCPECRGIWLDRGELDKIIDKIDSDLNREKRKEEVKSYQKDQNHNKYSEHNRGYGSGHNKKRGGIFSDLFDFGDD